MISLEDMYVKHVEENFDLAAIKNSKINLAYDSMFGAGQRVMKRLFPNEKIELFYLSGSDRPHYIFTYWTNEVIMIERFGHNLPKKTES